MDQILGAELPSAADGVKRTMTEMELSARLTACGIPHDADLPGKLLRYHAMLMDWNTRMDLTAVTEEAEMIDKHYVDSLIALKNAREAGYVNYGVYDAQTPDEVETMKALSDTVVMSFEDLA